jgi:putative endonuclease
VRLRSPKVAFSGVTMRENNDSPPAKPPAKKLKAADAKIPSPTRVAAFQTGLSAESRASAYLIAKGYRILARRYRTPYGEIDIVARRRNLLAFIEVKARANLDDAAYSVTPQQQQRIVAAAQAWLMNQPDYSNFDMRFDVVLITPRHFPRHLMAAFDASA